MSHLTYIPTQLPGDIGHYDGPHSAMEVAARAEHAQPMTLEQAAERWPARNTPEDRAALSLATALRLALWVYLWPVAADAVAAATPTLLREAWQHLDEPTREGVLILLAPAVEERHAAVHNLEATGLLVPAPA